VRLAGLVVGPPLLCDDQKMCVRGYREQNDTIKRTSETIVAGPAAAKSIYLRAPQDSIELKPLYRRRALSGVRFDRPRGSLTRARVRVRRADES